MGSRGPDAEAVEGRGVTSPILSFVVYGKAQTAGSKKPFALRRKDGSLVMRPGGGGPVVTVVDDNPKSKDWKTAVSDAARAEIERLVKESAAAGFALIRGPLEVEFTFFRLRPKGHYRKHGGLSRDGLESPYPTAKPDALKLARAAEDALTEVVWADDAQIVTEILRKRWGDPPRLEVAIRTAETERS